jgi:MFS family permease
VEDIGSQRGLYRGWNVVAIGFAIFFFAYSGSSTLPLVYAPVIAEFGWTRVQATMIYTYASGASAVMAIFIVGPLVARFGLKAVQAVALIVLGGGMASFLLIQGPITYYVAGLLLGVGQGTVMVLIMVLVSRWFTRNIGLACAITVAGTSLGGTFFPFYAAWALQALGWRATMGSLGIGVFLIALPLCLVARTNPSPQDLLREAAPQARDALSAEIMRGAEPDLTLAQVRRHPAFWMMAAGIVLTAIVDQALFQHTVLFLTQQIGLSTNIAATAVSVTFVIGIIAKVIAGRFFDWLSIRGVAIWYVLLGLSTLSAFAVEGVVSTMLFALGRGIVHGGLVTESGVLAKHVFGPRHVDRVLPVYAGSFAVGSAIGPVTLAMIVDRTSGYGPGFLLFAGLSLVAALLIVAVRPLYRDRLRAATGV